MANGPAYDAVDVFVQARACLNDQAGETYIDSKLVTYFQMAWEDLELELIVLDASVLLSKEVKTVAAGTTSIPPASVDRPAAMWIPIALEESEVGKNVWLPMRQQLFDHPTSAENRADSLLTWSYYEGTIYFAGAKTNRDVLIYFFKATTEVDATSTDLGKIIPFSRGFLSRKVSAFAYALQKKDFETAQVMQDEAVNFKERIGSILVKAQQSMPMRRRGYRGGRIPRTRMRMG